MKGSQDCGVYNTSITIDGSGTPYVVYQNNFGYSTAMKYTGSTWVTIGSAGFSAGEALFPSIAIDASGTPYVAYQDWGNGERATVMKLDTSTTGIVNTANSTPISFSVFPNPNDGSFVMQLSTPTNEPAQITITNILGEKIKECSISTNKETAIQLDAPRNVFLNGCYG